MFLISKKNLAAWRAVSVSTLAALGALGTLGTAAAQQPADPAVPAPSAAPAVRADSIERVVVFGDRAQVTRRAQAECVGGEAKVPFGPLPASAARRTLRGAAEDGATAVGLTARMVEFNPVDDTRLAPIRAQLDGFDEQLRENDRKVATEQAARSDGEHYGEFLNTLVVREARNAKPVVANWGRSLEVLRTERAGHDSTLVALNRERIIFERERSVVQHQYDALLGGNRDTEAWQVEVAVDCGGKARVPVTLSYVVPGATWQPEYDLRFAPTQGAVGPGKVTLGVGAAVQQATGEDWTDVTLVLSTAKPWLGVEAPVPAPMRIGGHKGSDKKALVQATERREVLTRNGPAQQTAEGPGAASLDDKGQSVTLTLPHKVDIRSDGRPYWAPVDQLNTAGQASFVAVPKKSAAVYRLVRFDNPSAYPLLAGRLHTWRDDAFVGTQRVEHTGPGAPVEVSLGTDETLRVVREVVEDRTREPGFLSSTRTLPRAYAMKVRSSGGRPVVVELRDQLPVSKSDDVKVSIDTERTTPGYQHDKLTGRMTWPVTVPASGEGEVKLGYRIKLPDDWKL